MDDEDLGPYNHDLFPGERFLAHVPKARPVLTLAEPAATRFRETDREARLCKALYHRTGALSLVLGSVALLGVCFELVVGALGGDASPGLTVAIELAALASLGILLFARLRRYRQRWREACFARERIRQWHFESLLDGELVEQRLVGTSEAQERIESSWAEFEEDLRNPLGALGHFTQSASTPLFFNATPIADPEIKEQLWKALRRLRFLHQDEYVVMTVSEESAISAVSMPERAFWAETVGSVALAMAVVIPAVQIILVATLGSGEPDSFRVVAHPVLFGAAVAMAVLSASARAFKAGYTLPEELEAYDEYLARVREHLRLFEAEGATDEMRLAAHARLEEESVKELRHFLRMKGKSTFLLG